MRPLWKGAVSFGLIYVPIKLYAATEAKNIKFKYLHKKCKTPIRYMRYCPYCDTEVPMEEIVRGYEYEKGKHVVLEDEDFESLPDADVKSVDIMEFVNFKEVDPLYFQKAYFLVPGDGGQKVYELLKKTMLETGKAAVVRVAIRNKTSLAIIRSLSDALVMNTIFYADEVRSAKTLPEMNYNVKLNENELSMAINLVNTLSAEFELNKYTNEHRQSLMDVINTRIEGEVVEDKPGVQEQGKVLDLMEALKSSIELAQKKREPAKKRKSAL